MGWKVTFGGTKRVPTDDDESMWEGGTVVNLDDLNPETFDTIASQETDANWWVVYRWPCSVAGRMWLVAEAAANHAGVDVPARPANMRDQKLLLAQFEQTVDIEDKPFVDGFPQTPVEPENGSPSGPSEDSAGDPPTSDESQ